MYVPGHQSTPHLREPQPEASQDDVRALSRRARAVRPRQGRGGRSPGADSLEDVAGKVRDATGRKAS